MLLPGQTALSINYNTSISIWCTEILLNVPKVRMSLIHDKISTGRFSVSHLHPPFNLIQGPTVQFETAHASTTRDSEHTLSDHSARNATEVANLHIIVRMKNTVLTDTDFCLP